MNPRRIQIKRGSWFWLSIKPKQETVRHKAEDETAAGFCFFTVIPLIVQICIECLNFIHNIRRVI